MKPPLIDFIYQHWEEWKEEFISHGWMWNDDFIDEDNFQIIEIEECDKFGNPIIALATIYL